jgi:hypothetical protein
MRSTGRPFGSTSEWVASCLAPSAPEPAAAAGERLNWLDYRLEHHPEFPRRIAAARLALQAGRGVRLEDLPE